MSWFDRVSRLLALLITLLAISGCGYSVVSRSSGQLDGKLLNVQMFANRTYQPNVEAQLRRALLDEIQGSGAGTIAPEQSADMILSGDVESLVIENVAFSAQDKAMMYRVVLTVQANLQERTSGRVIWKTRETVRQEYPANVDTALLRNSRDAAIAASCREMAGRLARQFRQAF